MASLLGCRVLGWGDLQSFIRSLVSAGFHVERGHSLDGDEIFVTFGFSQQALMHWADKLNFPMELKVRMHGMREITVHSFLMYVTPRRVVGWLHSNSTR